MSSEGKDLATSLNVLRILSSALTVPHSLDSALQHIVRMTGELMETDQTALLLRDEDREELIVRTRVGIAGPNIRVGHPLVVPARLKSILWRLRSLHQISWINSGIDDIGFPILVMPVCVRGERIGVLITGKPRGQIRTFDPVHRGLFSLIAPFASLVIENAKVYDYLRQNFAQRSKELIDANRREAGTGDPTRQLMVSSLNNPNKVVRLLAETFYKELARAGFSPGHITTGAAHILGCITRNEPVTTSPLRQTATEDPAHDHVERPFQ